MDDPILAISACHVVAGTFPADFAKKSIDGTGTKQERTIKVDPMTIEELLTDPLIAMMNAADAIEAKSFALLLHDAAGRVRSRKAALRKAAL
ncbi:hypothetical protein [Rhizobium sp. CNPSo 4039]|uniref:hypothetical protein n=1 Tax=Rhizobium sp. CNPSo 4039 TaxID=3021409 RepID=UPI00254BEBBB|nr:hypothetical protein [Rhizobium sp. CNPSo 4039]MDK4716026.1 hypothetical protein [Rhizobium sp. CNPSo 4039]